MVLLTLGNSNLGSLGRVWWRFISSGRCSSGRIRKGLGVKGLGFRVLGFRV